MGTARERLERRAVPVGLWRLLRAIHPGIHLRDLAKQSSETVKNPAVPPKFRPSTRSKGVIHMIHSLGRLRTSKNNSFGTAWGGLGFTLRRLGRCGKT